MTTRREIIKYGTGIAVAIQVPSFIIGCSSEALKPLKGTTSVNPSFSSNVINADWEERAKQLENSGIVKSKENIDEHHSTEEELKEHLPVVTFGHNALAMKVTHPMQSDHFITTMYAKDQNERVFGLKEFLPVDDIAWASFMIPQGTTKVLAFAFCSLHDHWCAKMAVPHQ